MDHIRELKDAKIAYRSAAANTKSPTEKAKQLKRLTDAAKELRRYVAATKKGVPNGATK